MVGKGAEESECGEGEEGLSRLAITAIIFILLHVFGSNAAFCWDASGIANLNIATSSPLFLRVYDTAFFSFVFLCRGGHGRHV